ncbi:MAG: MurR/RpiR family transcriptional regulator [Terriglobales bacterium]
MPRSPMQHLMVMIDIMQQMVYQYKPTFGGSPNGLPTHAEFQVEVDEQITGGRFASSLDGNGREQLLAMTALESAIARSESKLNFSRRRLLREILENSQDAYFLSSRDLAKRYKVDTATIVRTIQALGYKRYANFLADLRSHFVSRITPYSVMKTATRERRGLADRVTHSLETESRNLEAMRASLRPNQVIDLAKRILSGRRIMIVGVDFAASLSRLLAYGLVSLGHDATAPEGSTGNLQQSVGLLGPKDLFIAISFGRCLRATVDSMLYAHARKVPTFGITDNEASPIARFADSFWITSIAHPSFHGSYVAPLAAMNALLVACAHIHPRRSLQVLRRKEQEFGSGTRWYSPENDEGSCNQPKKNSHG